MSEPIDIIRERKLYGKGFSSDWDRTLRKDFGRIDHVLDKYPIVLNELERTRADRDRLVEFAAMLLREVGSLSHIAWGWNPELQEHGFYRHNIWVGTSVYDVVAAETAGETGANRWQTTDLRRKAEALDAIKILHATVYPLDGFWWCEPDANSQLDLPEDSPLAAIEAAVAWLEKQEQTDDD